MEYLRSLVSSHFPRHCQVKSSGEREVVNSRYIYLFILCADLIVVYIPEAYMGYDMTSSGMTQLKMYLHFVLKCATCNLITITYTITHILFTDVQRQKESKKMIHIIARCHQYM